MPNYFTEILWKMVRWSATHNNLSSEHALIGDTTLTPTDNSWVFNWHITDTNYGGFNTGYGDGHVEWTNADKDYFDNNVPPYYIANLKFFAWWGLVKYSPVSLSL